MTTDLHTHTLVSDGELDPISLLREASSKGISHLSITDHDSLGAYSWDGGSVFREAERLGIRLTVGIELDAYFAEVELHVLAFDIRRDNAELNNHLDRVERARAERIRKEIAIVNGRLGEQLLTEAMIFVPGRRTFMKPHLVHPILKTGRFETYEEANAWLKKNVKSGVNVPKPALAEILALVHGAGGWSSLAHPGYYRKEGADFVALLGEFKGMGLDGVEVDYPYHSCSPRLFTAADEKALHTRLTAEVGKLGLKMTRGSDCHTREDFERIYGKVS
jgi:predicted metal-dependent phosphoesterase TrpH